MASPDAHLWDACVHEAGHVVVAWRVLGRVADWAQVHPGPPATAQTLVDIPYARTLAAGRGVAAYVAGGRAAVIEARGRGLICPSVGERDGYGAREHAGCDAAAMAELEHRFGTRLEAEAIRRAGAVVRAEWNALLRVARRLDAGLPLHREYLEVLLEGR